VGVPKGGKALKRKKGTKRRIGSSRQVREPSKKKLGREKADGEKPESAKENDTRVTKKNKSKERK